MKTVFWITKRIRKAYKKNEFVGLLVFGKQGSGKSVYALKIAYQIYRDWDMVFNNIVFTLEDLIKRLTRNITEKNRIPVLIWDDAGVHGNKYKFYDENGKEISEDLKKLMDVIRSGIAGFIITTPTPDDLLAVLRGYDWFFARITKKDDVYRHAIIYQQIIMPNKKRFIKKKAIDRYKVRLPDYIYKKRYYSLRESYYLAVLNELRYKYGIVSS